MENNGIHIIHLNIRSLRKHFNEVQVLLEASKCEIDIIILSEINIKKEELPLYNLPGYESCAVTRENKRGGGILIYAKDVLGFSAEIANTQAMEAMHGKLKKDNHTLHIIALYRPPSKNKSHFIEQIGNMIKKIPSAENIIVIGDTNIDLLNNALYPIIARYKNTLCGLGLRCAIPNNEVTREAIVDGRRETSCLDHAWVREGRSISCMAYVLESYNISDHHAIGLLVNYKHSKNVNTNNIVREVVSNKIVRQKLENYDWIQLLSIKCPLMLYQTIVTVFNTIYNESTIIVPENKKRDTQPWVDKSLYSVLNRRDYLFRMWKQSPKDMNRRLEYTRFRNKANKLVNEAKYKYRQAEIKKCSGDYRKIWANINSWLGRGKANLDSVILGYLGKQKDMYTICTNFAKTFTSEIKNIKHKCNLTFLDRKTYINPSLVSFRYNKVSSLDIQKIINTLSSEKAPGIDKIRVKDIKYLCKTLSPILANFINMCMSKAVYPDQLKYAIIRPIYKSGSHLEYVNYRPIAILPVIDKIVEKVIVGQVNKFLESNNILSTAQHGFRKGRSTATALTRFADYVNESLNSGKQIIALFIDYKKAFDTLDHNVLLQAMDECGICGPANKWFLNYLTNRKICTVVNGVAGEEALVDMGVPTGSVFGPVGYIMHVNSVVNVVSRCQVYMYADDMCLLYASKEMTEAHDNIQSDFESITQWAHDNGIILNVAKTKYMHIHSPYNQCAKSINKSDFKIVGHTYECLHKNKKKCNCESIQSVDRYTYLGLTVDRNFNWRPHVNDICDRLRSVLCKFYQLRKVINKHTMSMVYYALADSVLSYGLSIYGRTFMTYKKEIKCIQTRLIKYLVSKKIKTLCNKDYEKLYPICKILPIDLKVKFLIAMEHYYTDEYKIKIENSYNTRNVIQGKLVEPKISNYYGERTSKYLVPKIYNELDLLRREDKISKYTLKAKLRGRLLGECDTNQ